MRYLIGIVALLVIVLAGVALAADPPGGPSWYQLADHGLNVSTTSGTLLIAAGTPGQLVSVRMNGNLQIRFERGLATWLGKEITTDGGFSATLTIDVEPGMVRAFVKQPLSSK